MRKNVFGRQFKRDKNQRKALFKGLLNALVLNERIKTTEEKAKAIKGDAEKLITKAKRGGDRAYKLLEPQIAHDAVRKIIDDIAPRFMQRQGGYTRITKIGRRTKDNASMVMLEWTVLGINNKSNLKPEDVQIIEPAEAVESTVKVTEAKKKESKKEVKPKTAKTTVKKAKAKKEEETK
jgi:large subunit ribosomal protein L17